MVFLASAIWGVLWVPMRYAEPFGISELWVVFLPPVLLIFRIMQYVSPGLVGILMLSEVLVAALSSWLFLQEALSLSQWAGVLAILVTGVFVGLTEKAAGP